MTMLADTSTQVIVRNTRQEDSASIIELCHKVYPDSHAWLPRQLASHLEIFPEGQFVAEEVSTGRVVGMAASLIVWWDDYEFTSTWREFTSNGYFTNHDPDRGRTLYGAEIMVDPALRGRGIGKKIYAARRELCQWLALLRIRAGARLRGYYRYADRYTPEQYVMKVVREVITDATLTFQLRQGYEVIAIVPSYLRHDPESLGHAAVIEWLNPEVATLIDLARRDQRFLRGAMSESVPPIVWE